nr:hypothetical protein B0A51_03684 [Rachicladosporium sp. CCFEE 5018]
MPKVNTFLHLAGEVGVPTEYGKECCEGALRRLATLITNRINDKSLNPAMLTSKGSLETRTWLSEKSLVREAMSVLVKGMYFKQCKPLDFQPTPPPENQAFTSPKTFHTATASAAPLQLITPPSTIVSSRTATPATRSPAMKAIKSTVTINVLVTPPPRTTGDTDVEPGAPGDSLRRCCKMTKDLLTQGNDALDRSNDPASDIPAGLVDKLPHHTIQANKRIGKWLRSNTGQSNPNAESADSGSTFPGVDVPTPSHSDVSTVPDIDVPTPSHSDADSWDGDAVE